MVSVIISVYNKEKVVKQCIKSVISQTYADLEIVVIDDGSTDSSLTICENFAKTDQRISVYSKENGGVEKARLYGLEKCHGEYVTFVDSDDWLPKNAIKKLEDVLVENDGDVSFGTVTRVLDKWKLIKRKSVPEIYQNRIIEHEEFIQKHLQCFSGWGSFPINVCAKLYRRDLLTGIEPVGLVYGEDLCFNLQVLPKALKFVSIPDNVYFYRWGGVTTYLKERLFSDAVKQYRYKIPYYIKYGRQDCVEMSNIELLNYFYTYVDACILNRKRYSEKDIETKIEHILLDDFFHNIVYSIQSRSVRGHELYRAIKDKDIKKIILLRSRGIERSKYKRKIMKIIGRM